MATHPPQRAGSQVDGKWLAWPRTVTWFRENVMFSVYIDKVGDMAVLQCEGRIVRSEAAFELREVVTSQRDARVVFIDLSEKRPRRWWTRHAHFLTALGSGPQYSTQVIQSVAISPSQAGTCQLDVRV